MATYCYYCPACGLESTAGDRETRVCGPCLIQDQKVVEIKRDYKAERVGFNGLAELRRQRETGTDGLSGKKAMRDLFLPTAKEMAKPGDPTGQKGLHEWNEKHEPRESNKAPLRPETDRRVW